MGKAYKLDEIEARLDAAEELQGRLSAFAEERQRMRTAAAYREENGTELADDDDSNLADVAAIDGFDEEDHETAEAIDETIESLGRRVGACDEKTEQATLEAISGAIDDLVSNLGDRADALGYKGGSD